MSQDPQLAGVVDDRANSEVVASLVATIRALIRKELELAKLELKKVLVDKAIAIAAALFAALLGIFLVAFVGVTIAKAFEEVVAPWLAWLITTGIYLLVTVILLLVAVRFAKRPVVPERTKASLQDNVEWAKQQVAAGPSSATGTKETA